MAALVTRQAGLGNPSRAHLIAQLLSLAPLGVLLAVAASPQAALMPATDVPELLGVPVQSLLSGLAVLWALGGTLLIRYAVSPLRQSLALLAFTIPATIMAVLGQLLILIL